MKKPEVFATTEKVEPVSITIQADNADPKQIFVYRSNAEMVKETIEQLFGMGKTKAKSWKQPTNIWETAAPKKRGRPSKADKEKELVTA